MAKAVRFDAYGDSDVLYVADVERPTPKASAVVVEVKAAGINPGEIAIRTGALDSRWPATFPSGQGSDFAGVVVDVGEDVTSFTRGDEVIGYSHERSSQADYVVVPVTQVINKPPTLAWDVAGALYVAGVTAHQAVAAVKADSADTVVVSAAAGGVGSVVVQLLRLRGATVLGIASEPNHEWLRSIGVIPVAYGDRLAARIRELAPTGVNAFIDTFGPQYVELAVELGVAPERIDTIIAYEAAEKYGAKSEGSMASPDPLAALSEVAELAASGQLEITIAATYPLDQVRRAFEDLADRHTHGKIVLIPTP